MKSFKFASLAAVIAPSVQLFSVAALFLLAPSSAPAIPIICQFGTDSSVSLKSAKRDLLLGSSTRMIFSTGTLQPRWLSRLPSKRVVAGTAASGKGTFFNTVPAGINKVRGHDDVLWDNPSPTFVASDRPFTIDLSNAILNEIEGYPLAGPIIDAEAEAAAVVCARITQTASSAPPSVPDSGNTALLLGLGLVAVVFARKRLLPAAKGHSIN